MPGKAIGVVSLALVLALGGCCLSTGIQDLSTGGETTGGKSSSGGRTSGGSTTGATCPSGETLVNGSCEDAGPACAPHTIWLGDVCVTQDCVNGSWLPCELSDGGLGECMAGICFDPVSDPNNCGTYGTVCPAGSSCIDR